MKRVVVGMLGLFVAAAFTLPVIAEEGKAAPEKEKPVEVEKEKKEAPAAEEKELEVVGKLSKNDAGKFIVTKENGTKVPLPAIKGEEGAPKIDLAALVGKNVKVVGKGKAIVKQGAEGKKQEKITLNSVTSVTEVQAAAPVTKEEAGGAVEKAL